MALFMIVVYYGYFFLSGGLVSGEGAMSQSGVCYGAPFMDALETLLEVLDSVNLTTRPASFFNGDSLGIVCDNGTRLQSTCSLSNDDGGPVLAKWSPVVLGCCIGVQCNNGGTCYRGRCLCKSGWIEPTCSDRQYDPQIIGFWPFADFTGLQDLSGNDYHGSLPLLLGASSSATSTLTNGNDGPFGAAKISISMSGPYDFVQFARFPSFSITSTSLTIACYVKTASSSTMPIVEFLTLENRPGAFLVVNNRFAIASVGGVAPVIALNCGDLEQKWTLILMRYDAITGNLSLNCNTASESLKIAKPSGEKNNAMTAMGFKLGYSPIRVDTFRGQIACLAIFKTAKIQSEDFQAMCAQKMAPQRPGYVLVPYLSFEDTTQALSNFRLIGGDNVEIKTKKLPSNGEPYLASYLQLKQNSSIQSIQPFYVAEIQNWRLEIFAVFEQDFSIYLLSSKNDPNSGVFLCQSSEQTASLRIRFQSNSGVTATYCDNNKNAETSSVGQCWLPQSFAKIASSTPVSIIIQQISGQINISIGPASLGSSGYNCISNGNIASILSSSGKFYLGIAASSNSLGVLQVSRVRFYRLLPPSNNGGSTTTALTTIATADTSTTTAASIATGRTIRTSTSTNGQKMSSRRIVILTRRTFSAKPTVVGSVSPPVSTVITPANIGGPTTTQFGTTSILPSVPTQQSPDGKSSSTSTAVETIIGSISSSTTVLSSQPSADQQTGRTSSTASNNGNDIPITPAETTVTTLKPPATESFVSPVTALYVQKNAYNFFYRVSGQIRVTEIVLKRASVKTKREVVGRRGVVLNSDNLNQLLNDDSIRQEAKSLLVEQLVRVFNQSGIQITPDDDGISITIENMTARVTSILANFFVANVMAKNGRKFDCSSLFLLLQNAVAKMDAENAFDGFFGYAGIESLNIDTVISNDPNSNNNSNDGLSGSTRLGLIIGLITGSSVLVCLLLAAFFIYRYNSVKRP